VNATARLSAFAVAVAVVFGAAWAAGRLSGPVEPSAAAEQGTEQSAGQPGGHGQDAGHGQEDSHGPEGAHGGDAAAQSPAGLAMASGGYRMVAESTSVAAATGFRFRIVDDAGAAVTGYDVEHDKLMHLIVVRRDGIHYQHLHPVLAADGTWSTPLSLTAAGSYRAFADFRPRGGERTTLGVDLDVPGDYRPASPPPSKAFDVDGYRVTLDADGTALTATVIRNGQPVTDLQPYLGSYGHLVALRAGDLAFLHVHPDSTGTAGPQVRFTAEFPTAGRYRMFLDFQHGGVVRTAEFTLDVQS
jgi:hypothetical protein